MQSFSTYLSADTFACWNHAAIASTSWRYNLVFLGILGGREGRGTLSSFICSNSPCPHDCSKGEEQQNGCRAVEVLRVPIWTGFPWCPLLLDLFSQKCRLFVLSSSFPKFELFQGLKMWFLLDGKPVNLGWIATEEFLVINFHAVFCILG